jgi:hypothetical protein
MEGGGGGGGGTFLLTLVGLMGGLCVEAWDMLLLMGPVNFLYKFKDLS